MPISRITLSQECCPTQCLTSRGRNSSLMPSTTFGTSPTSSKLELMAYSDVASRTKKQILFLHIAVRLLMEDTLHTRRPLPRYYNLVSFGPLFSKMQDLLF